MGSREDILQGNALKVYKSKLVLSSKQKSVLIGSILGDGTLRVGFKAKEANFKVDQGIKQKEYTFWKYDYFKEWVLTPPKISYRVNEEKGKYEKSWWFRTVRHSEITFFYRLFYKDGKKVIPFDIRKLLDPLSFAVLIMDDGSLNRGIYDISTYSFTEREVIRLMQAFRDKFNLKPNYYSDRKKGFRMYFPTSQTNFIGELIKPFIVPCLKYKLPSLTP